MRFIPNDSVTTLRLYLPMLCADAASVLKHRYGLFGVPARTREQTAAILRRSVADVYAIEHGGIDDLRRLMRVPVRRSA